MIQNTDYINFFYLKMCNLSPFLYQFLSLSFSLQRFAGPDLQVCSHWCKELIPSVYLKHVGMLGFVIPAVSRHFHITAQLGQRSGESGAADPLLPTFESSDGSAVA